MTQNKKKSSIRIVGPNGKWNGRNSTVASRSFSSGVFIGPSVDGTDKEYVKVLSGHVDRKKPSFA